jgi:hypothetical protein
MTNDGVTVFISEPVARVLQALTHESNLELAIAKVLKELVQYKLKDALDVISKFEKKYSMSLSEFEQACLDGRIANPFSHEIEKDGRDWDKAISDKGFLLKAKNTLEETYPESPEKIVFSRS